MMKLTVDFRNFAKAPKNLQCRCDGHFYKVTYAYNRNRTVPAPLAVRSCVDILTRYAMKHKGMSKTLQAVEICYNTVQYLS
jgi:hypothetical protein